MRAFHWILTVKTPIQETIRPQLYENSGTRPEGSYMPQRFPGAQLAALLPAETVPATRLENNDSFFLTFSLSHWGQVTESVAEIRTNLSKELPQEWQSNSYIGIYFISKSSITLLRLASASSATGCKPG